MGHTLLIWLIDRMLVRVASACIGFLLRYLAAELSASDESIACFHHSGAIQVETSTRNRPLVVVD